MDGSANFTSLQVRRALKTFVSDSPEYERLLPFVKGNVGFVFTNGDLKETRDLILANRVAAPARAGAVAPVDVWVPAGNTGMEPGKTSFFQALGVPTKIARGTIEITTDLKLVEAAAKVGPSEATLLNMLNISPFTFGMGISQVYDNGQTFDASVLDIGEEQLLKTLSSAITSIACISLAISFPTLPSVMHSVVNSYKNVLAVAIETEFSWPEIEELKDRIANPDAYAAAAPAAGAASGGAAAAPVEEEKEEEAEDSDDEGFGGLLYVPPHRRWRCETNPLTKPAATKSKLLPTMNDRLTGILVGITTMRSTVSSTYVTGGCRICRWHDDMTDTKRTKTIKKFASPASKAAFLCASSFPIAVSA